MMGPLLSVRISLDYPRHAGVLRDLAFDMHEGEIFGLAGTSGSGKSTIALSILGLIHLRGGRIHGSIRFAGRELVGMKERELRRLRGKEISLVMQSPAAALNPVLRLETHLREAWRVHSSVPWRSARPEIRAVLERLGLRSDDEFLRRYPGEVSVGQAQRVVLALAVLHRPRLIIADEPTSALDADSQAEVLGLLRSLNRGSGAAVLFISHDRESMNEIADRTGILSDGRLVHCSGEREPAGIAPALTAGAAGARGARA